MRPMKVLSLFSGAGGLDIGFHLAGFEIIGCVEIETIFCKTLERNRQIGKYITPDCQIFNQDIATFDVTQLSTTAIDFVIGGPPCQTYSASGRRIGGAPGLDDARGRLFEHYCRIITELQPKGFLFENVRGLLGVNSGAAWKAVVAAFSELGYKVSYQLLDTAAYGVPQHRERLILVGTKADQNFLFPRPLFGPDSPNRKPYVGADEVLLDLQDPQEPYHEYDGKYGYLLSGIPEGMNYSYYTAEMGHPNPVFAWRSKFSSFLYKIAQDKPVKTIQAQLGKFAGPFHWKNRRLTVAELKRLQAFPDDYEFVGSYDQISRQIGNSVPPELARHLGQAVVKQLFDPQAYLDLELMPADFKQTFDARKGRVAAQTRSTTRQNLTNKPTAQLTLWDTTTETPKQNSKITTATPVNEKFVLSYSEPVKRTILDFESTIQALETGVSPNSNFVNKHLFIVETVSDKNLANKLQVNVRELEMEIENFPSWQLNLQLYTPLSDATEKLEIRLFCSDQRYVYVAWDVAEEIIKQRSAYISLVALYGHFAEPKIKFTAELRNLTQVDTPLTNLVGFFSCFENCGRNLPTSFIAQSVGVSHDSLKLALSELRRLRYDIRSHRTSVRIPEDYYFCAYPFPELSANYQLNKPV